MQSRNTYNILLEQPPMPWASILARILCPPILIWDLAKYAANAACGKWVGSIVLMAQDYYQDEDNKRLAENWLSTCLKHNQAKVAMQNYVLDVNGLAKLDTIELQPKNRLLQKPEDRKYIIHFVANAVSYEDYAYEMIDDVKELDCHVIGFNYRGVMKSEGQPTSSRDLVDDGLAQVQHLLNQGVKPENITLKGVSLGGAVSTLVAEQLHQQNICVNEFNNRSFSSISQFLIGKIRTGAIFKDQSGHEETFANKFLGWIAKPFIKFAIALTGWEMDAASAFKKIPQENKEYMVVRSSKHDRKKYGSELKDDAMITHSASLYYALKQDLPSKPVKKTKEKDQNIISNHITGPHFSIIPKHIESKANREFIEWQKTKQKINRRKMSLANGVSRSTDAHNVSDDALINREGLNGKEFFYEFWHKTNHKVTEPLPPIRHDKMIKLN